MQRTEQHAPLASAGSQPRLPNEIWFEVFRFLDVPTLLRARLVCRAWDVGAHTDSLWKRHVVEHSGLDMRVGKSWRLMYQDLNSDWCAKIRGFWNLHCPAVHFEGEHRFEVAPGSLIPTCTSLRVAMEYNRLTVIEGRVVYAYGGTHRFIRGFKLDFLLEPVRSEHLHVSPEDPLWDLVRTNKVLAFVVHLAPQNVWMRGFLVRPEAEMHMPYYNRLPYRYVDPRSVIDDPITDEPVVTRSLHKLLGDDVDEAPLLHRALGHGHENAFAEDDADDDDEDDDEGDSAEEDDDDYEDISEDGDEGAEPHQHAHMHMFFVPHQHGDGAEHHHHIIVDADAVDRLVARIAGGENALAGMLMDALQQMREPAHGPP